MLNNSLTAQKVKFPIKDFSSKCDQICRKRRICAVFPTIFVLVPSFSLIQVFLLGE